MFRKCVALLTVALCFGFTAPGCTKKEESTTKTPAKSSMEKKADTSGEANKTEPKKE